LRKHVPILRPISVFFALLPFIFSIIRDWRAYIFFGEGRKLTRAQHKQRAERIRQRMGQLGPTFIKGAQVLAMREDMIPAIYAHELKKLQDQVPPFSSAEANRIIARSLGRPVEKIFDEFDPKPIAAASIGQVHQAWYKGTKVAVKVLRPGVERLVQTDLRVVFALLYVMAMFVDENLMRSFYAIVEEYRRMISLEMDFRTERKNAARLRHNFRNIPQVYIPHFVEKLTTREVAVIEFVEGARVDDPEGLRRMGMDPERLIDTMIEAYVRMAVVHGFIHADPHPGNLLIDRQQRLVILDHGMALEFPEYTRIELLKLVYAVVKNDIEGIVDGFYKLDMVDAEINRAVLRDAAQKLLSIQLTGEYTPRQMQQIAQDVLNTFYKFPLRLPNQLVYLLRASTLVEGIALHYNPRFNSIKAATPIVKRMLREIAFESDKPMTDRLKGVAKETAITLRELALIIHRFEREQMRVRLHEADMMEMERFLNSFLRRFLGGISICTLIIVFALRGPSHPIFLVAFVVVLYLLISGMIVIPIPRAGRRGPYFK
jgi:predicted unusual protein kinase regulating ubiquinone biosynthesis (AarF/ABC1/UbiB family)